MSGSRPSNSTAILNHAAPRFLIYEADFAPLVEHLRQACPAIHRFIETGPAYEELLTRGRIERPDIMAFDENAIGELFYTSGSTGTPKGVMLSHRTLYLHAFSVAASFAKEDDGVELHTIPLFHANGWGRAHSSTMYGLKQVMVRRFDPAHVLALIQEERRHGHVAGAYHGERADQLSGDRQSTIFRACAKSTWAARRLRPNWSRAWRRSFRAACRPVTA